MVLNFKRRRDVLAVATGFEIYNFSVISSCCYMYYIYKALRSCKGMSSIIVVSPLFSATTIGIGEESDKGKVINGECKIVFGSPASWLPKSWIKELEGRILGTLRSDNGGVHEDVAEK